MPTPTENETREEFMSRCVPMRHREHPSEDNKQSVAVCFSMWKQHKEKPKNKKKSEDKK